MVWGEWARLMKGQIDEGESPAREVRGDVQQWRSTCVREQGVVGQSGRIVGHGTTDASRSCRQMWSFVRQYAKPREVVNEFAKISVFCDFVCGFC